MLAAASDLVDVDQGAGQAERGAAPGAPVAELPVGAEAGRPHRVGVAGPRRVAQDDGDQGGGQHPEPGREDAASCG